MSEAKHLGIKVFLHPLAIPARPPGGASPGPQWREGTRDYTGRGHTDLLRRTAAPESKEGGPGGSHCH